MKFSVIIPFNRGTEYLHDCLQSLAEQVAYIYLDGEPGIGDQVVRDDQGRDRLYVTEPFKDFEVILVPDSPKDDISGIIEEYSYLPGFRVVEVSEGSGVGAARNAGIRQARGEYLYFLDADDFLYRDTLFRILESMKNYGDPDIVYGRKIWTWFSLNSFREVQLKKQEERDRKIEEEAKKNLAKKNFWRIIFRRKGLQEAGEENEGSEEDTELSDEVAEEILAIRDRKRAERESAKNEARAALEKKREELGEEEFYEYLRDVAAKRLIYYKKGIGNISVLNVAVRRSIVIDNDISFPDFRHYSDCEFLCRVLHTAKTFQRCNAAKYVKRNHNDPINFPALSQEKDPERFDELIAAYENTFKAIPEGGCVRYYVDLKFILYYTGFFAKQIRRAGGDEWRGARFEEVRRLMGMIPRSVWKQVDWYKRLQIKALLKDDVNRAYRLVSFRLGLKKARKCLTSGNARKKVIYDHVYLKKPVSKNTILFESFLGKNYSDSPKYLYEYIAKNYPGQFNLVWVLDNKTGLPYEGTKVRRGSLKYRYYMATAGFFVFNMRQPTWFVKREGMVFLETWHGTPLKRLVFDMDEVFSASPLYKQEVYKQSREWDYLIAANSFSSEVFRSCFMYDRNMLEYGYPRNDVLHSPDRDAIAAQIRKKLGIPLDRKTILYAPTWRDDEYYGKGQYKFELKLDLKAMKESLSDEYVILLRTHYFIADALELTGMEGFAYNLSKYDDIADIYLISDILITDYSSVFFDYANLKRPMLFYTYDIDKYRDMLRGFYFDMESTVPGPLLYTTEEVVDAVRNIDTYKARFAQRYDEFYERFCGWEDGHASENIVKEVILAQKN